MSLTQRRSLRQNMSTTSAVVSSPAQTRKYVLNAEKALKKKAMACQMEVKIKYEEKQGNNHVFEMSTGI